MDSLILYLEINNFNYVFFVGERNEQNNFKIIGVPEDIYFMNFIPIDINFIQILTISTMTLVITSFVSYSTSARSSKILPSQALKYE